MTDILLRFGDQQLRQVPVATANDRACHLSGRDAAMSDTTSKRDKDDDSQDPTSEAVDPDDDEFDEDLDNALFGDDDDVAEPADADADAKAEVAPVKGCMPALRRMLLTAVQVSEQSHIHQFRSRWR